MGRHHRGNKPARQLRDKGGWHTVSVDKIERSHLAEAHSVIRAVTRLGEATSIDVRRELGWTLFGLGAASARAKAVRLLSYAVHIGAVERIAGCTVDTYTPATVPCNGCCGRGWVYAEEYLTPKGDRR